MPEEGWCRKRVGAGRGFVPEEGWCRKSVGAGRGLRSLIVTLPEERFIVC